jgi:hypothetical protein
MSLKQKQRKWQKAIDVIAADRKTVYEEKSSRNGLRIGIHPNNNDVSNSNHLAIHELCKMTTSPTSVRFSNDEISDDEEDDEDDEHSDEDHTAGLDQIFDACELEEGTKMYEVTQFMIDVSHTLGPVRVARSRDDDDENDNASDHGSTEGDRRGNAPAGPGNDDDVERSADSSQEQSENDDRVGRFAIHESILTCTDSMGKTPLHILCENSCDLNMMRVILGSTREDTGNPRAPTALSLILAKDSRGSTPLHYLAYSRQCPFSSLKLMMEYCKPRASGNDNGEGPGDWIDPTLCTDDDGETPLHWALAGYVSSRRIKELTRYSVDAIMVQNEKGETPFDQFTTNFVDTDWTDHDVCGHEVWENIEQYLRVISENQSNIEGKNTTEHDNNVDEFGCADSEWLPVHFLAGSVYDFPPIFADLALKYCRDDLKKVNANGMLPLHLACGRKCACISKHSDGKRDNETTILATKQVRNSTTGSLAMKILKMFQRGSLTPTSNKRLALHLAVETEKPLSLIAALIRTYPRSLNIVDPVTKLWPYVLAGVSRDSQEKNNSESLSVSFALLRADPSILHLVLKNQRISNLTDREKSSRYTTESSYAEEESKLAEEAYMEHSSRRIRRHNSR